MGFGILFFGYFLTFAFTASNVYFFADIIGCIVMLMAFSKLTQYNRYYSGAVVSTMALTLFCLSFALRMLFRIEVSSAVAAALDVAKAISSLGIHVFTFLGIRGISKGAECGKLVHKSERCLVLNIFYYAAAHIVLFAKPLLGEAAAYISLVVYFYWLICFIYNLTLIYQAFGILYSPEEEEKGPKRSRFKLINFMNDKMDEFDANSNKYRRESMEMALEEAERRRKEKEKNNPRNHSKKKRKK